MDWPRFYESLRAGSFFEPLGTLSTGAIRERCRWLFLLDSPAIRDWISRDGWAAAALRHGDPAVRPILSALLQRHLRSLAARANPAPLSEFWEWVAASANLPDLKGARVWDGLAGSLTPHPPAASDRERVRRIAADELRYTRRLAEAATRLEPWASRLEWARDIVLREVDRRTHATSRAFARLAFAWAGRVPPGFRPALVIDMELGAQADGEREPWVDPPDLFDDEFHATLRRARDQFGPDFHPLRLRLPAEYEALKEVKLGLSGPSGGLAIGVAEALANWPSLSGRYRSLPGWVAFSACLGDASDRVTAVASLPAKFAAFDDEGVRVIGVAAGQCREAESLVGPGQFVVPCEGPPRAVARAAIRWGAAPRVDLRPLKRPGRVRLGSGDLRYAVAALFAMVALVAIGSAIHAVWTQRRSDIGMTSEWADRPQADNQRIEAALEKERRLSPLEHPNWKRHWSAQECIDLFAGLADGSKADDPPRRIEHVERLYRVVAAAFPDEADIHFHMGLTYHNHAERGRPNNPEVVALDGAVGCYAAAVRVSPGDFRFPNNMANSLRARGRHDEAVKKAEAARELLTRPALDKVVPRLEPLTEAERNRFLRIVADTELRARVARLLGQSALPPLDERERILLLGQWLIDNTPRPAIQTPDDDRRVAKLRDMLRAIEANNLDADPKPIRDWLQ